MRPLDEEDGRASGSGPTPQPYVICVGGYSVAFRPTFAAAAEAAREIAARRASADDVSIYETRTGIHFDLPLRAASADDFPHEALALLSRIGFPNG